MVIDDFGAGVGLKDAVEIRSEEVTMGVPEKGHEDLCMGCHCK